MTHSDGLLGGRDPNSPDRAPTAGPDPHDGAAQALESLRLVIGELGIRADLVRATRTAPILHVVHGGDAYRVAWIPAAPTSGTPGTGEGGFAVLTFRDP